MYTCTSIEGLVHREVTSTSSKLGPKRGLGARDSSYRTIVGMYVFFRKFGRFHFKNGGNIQNIDVQHDVLIMVPFQLNADDDSFHLRTV